MLSEEAKALFQQLFKGAILEFATRSIVVDETAAQMRTTPDTLCQWLAELQDANVIILHTCKDAVWDYMLTPLVEDMAELAAL